MKLLLSVLTLVFSLSVQGSFLTDLLEKLGVKKAPPEITLPLIPQIKNDGKVFGKKREKKNNVTYKKNEAAKYNYSYIKEIYYLVNNKSPDREFINKWMNVLSQGGSREGVYRALTLDSKYLALEQYKNSIKESTAIYAGYYMEEYLGRTLSKKKLLSVNIYTVSRTLTEKSLEVVDAFLSGPGDEIYDWYAVFSSEVASEYPHIWKNKMRANTSKLAHKAWAKQVPDDYIKSEVIIKLNKVLNYLELH